MGFSIPRNVSFGRLPWCAWANGQRPPLTIARSFSARGLCFVLHASRVRVKRRRCHGVTVNVTVRHGVCYAVTLSLFLAPATFGPAEIIPRAHGRTSWLESDSGLAY